MTRARHFAVAAPVLLAMPFTFAHPAAVVPLVGRFGLSGPALVIGTMTPDFEYFLRARLYGELSHTALGLVTFCLPVGLVLVALHENVVRAPLACAAPAWIRRRILVAQPKRHVVLVALSILIGAATHVLWDAFTHANTFITLNHPWLSERSLFGLPRFGLLQHTSTLLGFGVIAIAIARTPPSPDAHVDTRLPRAVLSIATVVGAIIVGVV